MLQSAVRNFNNELKRIQDSLNLAENNNSNNTDQEKSPENEELVNDAETKKSPPEIANNISENKIRVLSATIQQATPKNHLTLNMLNAVEAEVDDENQLEYDNGDDS
ncbi:hypothetical protein TNCV_380001 [Trichonephila clavipes]|nr:hypothetical protein TNCV_380001 [Trichonephila clavipes]